MDIEGWRYYNKAAVPTCAPHEDVNLTPIENGSIWKIGGITLFARWTSNFDCGYETSWWYVIKDTPFDITQLKSKRRYEINKGKKNFEVKRINPMEYVDELLKVQMDAYSAWPEKYRPQVDSVIFKKDIKNWTEKVVYGGFNRENGELSAYSMLTEHNSYVEFNVLRTMPEMERLGINAAMVATIVEDYSERMGQGFYVNDGSRAVLHETAFQDYLEKYFGFRKAYCKLNVKYRFPVNAIINALYPFKNRINKESRLGSKISAVLLMEEISRTCR